MPNHRPTTSGPPLDFANVPPQTTTMLDHSFTLQAVMELQKSVAELAAKTDRLIKDVETQGTKIDEVCHRVTFVKGALWVLSGLIVLVSTIAAVLRAASYFSALPPT